jgi:hypothetical protein
MNCGTTDEHRLTQIENPEPVSKSPRQVGVSEKNPNASAPLLGFGASCLNPTYIKINFEIGPNHPCLSVFIGGFKNITLS